METTSGKIKSDNKLTQNDYKSKVFTNLGEVTVGGGMMIHWKGLRPYKIVKEVEHIIDKEEIRLEVLNTDVLPTKQNSDHIDKRISLPDAILLQDNPTSNKIGRIKLKKKQGKPNKIVKSEFPADKSQSVKVTKGVKSKRKHGKQPKKRIIERKFKLKYCDGHSDFPPNKLILHDDETLVKAGDKFENLDSFIKFINENAKRWFFYYRCEHNKKGHCTIFKCVYGSYGGAARILRGVKKRPIKRTNCPCQIRLKPKLGSEEMIVVYSCNHHDHPLNQESFLTLPHGRRIPTDVKKEISDLLSIGVSTEAVKWHVKSLTGFDLHIKFFRNIAFKLKNIESRKFSIEELKQLTEKAKSLEELYAKDKTVKNEKETSMEQTPIHETFEEGIKERVVSPSEMPIQCDFCTDDQNVSEVESWQEIQLSSSKNNKKRELIKKAIESAPKKGKEETPFAENSTRSRLETCLQKLSSDDETLLSVKKLQESMKCETQLNPLVSDDTLNFPNRIATNRKSCDGSNKMDNYKAPKVTTAPQQNVEPECNVEECTEPRENIREVYTEGQVSETNEAGETLELNIEYEEMSGVKCENTKNISVPESVHKKNIAESDSENRKANVILKHENISQDSILKVLKIVHDETPIAGNTNLIGNHFVKNKNETENIHLFDAVSEPAKVKTVTDESQKTNPLFIEPESIEINEPFISQDIVKKDSSIGKDENTILNGDGNENNSDNYVVNIKETADNGETFYEIDVSVRVSEAVTEQIIMETVDVNQKNNVVTFKPENMEEYHAVISHDTQDQKELGQNTVNCDDIYNIISNAFEQDKKIRAKKRHKTNNIENFEPENRDKYTSIISHDVVPESLNAVAYYTTDTENSMKFEIRSCKGHPELPEIYILSDETLVKPGYKFANHNSFLQYINENARRWCFYYTCETSHKGNGSTYRCIYRSYKNSRQAQGLRRRNNIDRTECPCQIKLKNVPGSEALVVTFVCQHHDHPLSDESFLKLQHGRRLPPHIKDEVLDLLSFGVDVDILKKYVKKETSIDMSTKFFANMSAKLKEQDHERKFTIEELKKIREKIEVMERLYGDTVEENGESVLLKKKRRGPKSKHEIDMEEVNNVISKVLMMSKKTKSRRKRGVKNMSVDDSIKKIWQESPTKGRDVKTGQGGDIKEYVVQVTPGGLNFAANDVKRIDNFKAQRKPRKKRRKVRTPNESSDEEILMEVDGSNISGCNIFDGNCDEPKFESPVDEEIFQVETCLGHNDVSTMELQDDSLVKAGDEFQSEEAFVQYVNAHSKQWGYYYVCEVTKRGQGSTFRCAQFYNSQLAKKRKISNEGGCPCEIRLRNVTGSEALVAVYVCNHHLHNLDVHDSPKSTKLHALVEEEIKDLMSLRVSLDVIRKYIESISGVKTSKEDFEKLITKLKDNKSKRILSMDQFIKLKEKVEYLKKLYGSTERENIISEKGEIYEAMKCRNEGISKQEAMKSETKSNSWIFDGSENDKGTNAFSFEKDSQMKQYDSSNIQDCMTVCEVVYEDCQQITEEDQNNFEPQDSGSKESFVGDGTEENVSLVYVLEEEGISDVNRIDDAT